MESPERITDKESDEESISISEEEQKIEQQIGTGIIRRHRKLLYFYTD